MLAYAGVCWRLLVFAAFGNRRLSIWKQARLADALLLVSKSSKVIDVMPEVLEFLKHWRVISCGAERESINNPAADVCGLSY